MGEIGDDQLLQPDETIGAGTTGRGGGRKGHRQQLRQAVGNLDARKVLGTAAGLANRHGDIQA